MNAARVRLILLIKSRALRAQLNAHYKRDAKRARTGRGKYALTRMNIPRAEVPLLLRLKS